MASNPTPAKTASGKPPPPLLLLRNLRLLDPRLDEILDGHEVLIEGDRFREVSDRPIRINNAAVIDCGGQTVMPGLIDCHVHSMHSEVYIRRLEEIPAHPEHGAGRGAGAPDARSRLHHGA